MLLCVTVLELNSHSDDNKEPVLRLSILFADLTLLTILFVFKIATFQEHH